MAAPALAAAHPFLTLDQLRERERERDEPRARAYCRIQAVRLAWEGKYTRAEIARIAGLHPNRVAFWVKRFQRHGLDGFEDLPRASAPGLLTGEQKKEVFSWIEKGADPKTDGFARWTAKRLAARILDRFGVKVSTSAIYSWLWDAGARHRKIRPIPSKGDPVELAEWEKKDRGEKGRSRGAGAQD